MQSRWANVKVLGVLCLLTAQVVTAKDESSWWDFTCYSVPAAIGGVAAVAGAPFVLGGLGFGGAGVVAGSVAAALQSAGLTGAAFSAAQSAGAAGIGLAGKAALAIAGATTGAAYSGGCKVDCEED